MLSVPRWLFTHFKTLTGVCPMETFPFALEKKSVLIRKYFEQTSNKKRVKEILFEKEHNSSDAAEIVLLLMAHFEKEESSLFKLIDVSMSNSTVIVPSL